MHILLIYASRPRLTFGCLPGPYGLETLRAYARAVGADCEIVNPFLSRVPEAAMRRAIRGDTRLIGLSVRNLDDAFVLWDPQTAVGTIQTETCIDDAVQVMQWARQLAPDVPVVLGGSAFAHMPALLLEHLQADAGLAGPSEADFAALVEAMAHHGRSFTEVIRGLRSAVLPSRTLRLAPVTVAPAVRIPVVEREPVYVRIGGAAAVRTFTGCPLSCGHCMEHVHSRSIGRSALEHVADEVEGVLERHPAVQRIFLADSEVNLAGEARTGGLLDAIRARPAARDVEIMGYFNPHPLSRGLLERLAAGGCKVRITVDHVSDAVLARSGKNFRNRHLRAMVDDHAALGRRLSFGLLLGQPGETRDTVDEAIRFVGSIPEAIRGPIYFSPGVRVYPGTPIAVGLAAGELDRRWLREIPGRGGPLDPRVYCESWDPHELLAYVVSRSGGLLRPTYGHMAGFDAPTRAALQTEIESYHIGAAALGEDDRAALDAWSSVRADAVFLSNQQRDDLLRTRGALALAQRLPGRALADWRMLREQVAGRDPPAALDAVDRLIASVGASA